MNTYICSIYVFVYKFACVCVCQPADVCQCISVRRTLIPHRPSVTVSLSKNDLLTPQSSGCGCHIVHCIYQHVHALIADLEN